MLPFIGELRRRKVLHAALVYAAVGYATVEGASVFVPALHLPQAIVTGVALVVMLGFPIALVLAWILEFGPEGVQRTPAVDTEAAHASDHHVRLARPGVRTIVIALVFLVVGTVAGRLVGGPRALTRGNADGVLASIAVLPLSNLAASAETAPFVDGIHDDLLTALSRISSLRVISRTSVLGYAGTTKQIPQIAQELGVGHILEGGVQRAGDQVRINVQLIDGATDEHIWAETFTRTLTVDNIFAVQSEIADSIVRHLRANLTPDERQVLAARPTDDLEAYDHYQLGMSHFRSSLLAPSVREAAREFSAAVAEDATFSEAWARLAIAEATLWWEFSDAGARSRAERAANRSHELAPDEFLSRLAAGYIRYYGYRDYDGALRHFERALAMAPGDPEVLMPIGWVMRRQGRWDEAIERFEQALVRDPLHYELLYASLGLTNAAIRNFDAAERYIERALVVQPNDARSIISRATLPIMRSGDAAAALGVIRGSAPDPDAFASAALSSGRIARILSASAGDEILRTDIGMASVARADLESMRGEQARARAILDAARVRLEPLAAADTLIDTSFFGQSSMHLARVQARLGNRNEAIRLARRAMTVIENRGEAFHEGNRLYDLAEVYLVVGEHDLALDELERALDLRGGWLTTHMIEADPIWQPLRASARYRALIQRGGGSG